MQARNLSQRIVLFASLAMLVSIPLTGRSTRVAAQDTAASQGGLWITRVTPTAAASNPFDTLEIQFSSAVLEGTFTLSDVTFAGPGGTITPAGLSKLADDLYELDSAGLTGLDEYSLTVGPNIQDASAHSMDQDHDGTPGEAEDAYVGALFAAGVTISDTDTTYDGENLVIYGDTATIDGSHSFASVAVLGGATLAHSATTADTEYRLELTITDSLLISATAKIDVSERGYLYGRTLGNTTVGAATGYSGGSYGGLGTEWAGTTNWVYGDYRNPNELGSGGAPSGGAGGGLLRISADSAIVEGEILANGGGGSYYHRMGGSGGGIWLDVGTLSGSGTIAANGGNWGYDGANSGGGGRVAVYCDSLDGLNPAKQVTAHGGWAAGAGAVGTVYLKQTGGEGQLRLDSHGAYTGMYTPLGEGGEAVFTVDHLVISGTNVIAAPEHEMPIDANNISIFGDGMLTHQAATMTDTYSLRVTVADTLLISTAGKIDVSNRGYLVGRTQGNTTRDAAGGSSGGSFGGLGYSTGGGIANAIYGDYRSPEYPGSGGGALYGGGNGGGLVRVTAGTAVIDGQILADGGSGWYLNPSAGSGGGILLNVGTLSGSGTVRASGGAGNGGGSGGGGRVAVYAWDTTSLDAANITAPGGWGWTTDGEGTVHMADAPHLTLTGPASALYHGTEQLNWEPLGVNPAGVTVDLHASGDEGTVILGTDLAAVGSLDWDTTAVADGQYELTATFYDSSDVMIGQASLDALVANNAITWHSGTISAGETWAAGEMHVVEGELTVASGVTLILEAGVVVKFAGHASMTIEDGAIVSAPATAGAPVVLTSLADDATGGDTNLDGSQTLPLPGDWDGFFVPGTGQLSLNQYVELRYVRTTHYGTLGGDETWLGRSMHIVSGDLLVPTGATLTIEPGAVVKFALDQGITVQSGGQIIAQGNVAQPILFTSVRDDAVGGDTNRDGDQTSPEAGDWRGINVDGGQASLDHVALSYGAGTASGNWDATAAAVSTRNGGTVTLANSVIRDPFYEGIIAWGSGNMTIVNTIIAGADRGVNADGSTTVSLVNCTLDGNRVGIYGHNGTLEIDNTIIANSMDQGIYNPLSSPITIRYSNVWSESGVDYLGNISDQTGLNGNVSLDPRFAGAAGGNYRLQYVSPMIDAADGAVAPETDFMGAPRYDDPRTDNTGLPTGGGAYADVGAFEFVETAESDLDLVVAEVLGPLSAMAGETVTVTWTIINHGTGQVVGPWHDRVSLAADSPTRGVVELLAAEPLHQATLGPGESHTMQASFRVPGGTEGPWRWQVRANVHGEVFEGINWNNNASPLPPPFELMVPELVSGESVADTFAGPGEPAWYKVDQEAGQEILVTLEAAAGTGRTELYAGVGSMPTQQDFELRGTGSDEPNGRLSLPAPEARRTVYLLVEPEGLPGGTLGYTLEAQAVEFGLDSIGLEQVGNGGTATLLLFGSGFREGLEAQLHSGGGTTVVTTTAVVQDSGTAVASFDLSGVAAGVYDVAVVQEGEESILAAALTVMDGGEGLLEARILLPDQVRIGRPFQGLVEYENAGTIDITVPLLVLESSADNPMWMGEDCETCRQDNLQLLAIPTDRPSAGVLPPGKSYSVRFNTITGIVDARYTVSYKPADSTDPLDWEALKADVRPEGVSALWDEAWEAMTAWIGDTYGAYITALTEAADEAQSYGLELQSVPDLLGFMVFREMESLPGASLRGTVYTSAGYETLGQVTLELCDILSSSAETYLAKAWYDGRFSFRDVPTGIYSLRVLDHLPYPWGEVSIPAAEELQVLVWPTGGVAGRIVDTDGVSVEGALVSAESLWLRGVHAAQTDVEGRYTIAGVPSGAIYVTVDAVGHVAPEVQTLEVTDGETTGFSLALEAGGSLQGYVQASDGSPVAGAGILVRLEDSGVGKSETTAADGSFLVEGLAAGSYVVTSGAQGHGGTVVTGVTVANGETTAETVTLTVPGTVHITVTDADSGAPIEGASAVSNAPGAWEGPNLSDASGQVTLSDLAPGEHTVWVSASGYHEKEMTVVVTAGGTLNLDAALRPGNSISGTLKTSGGDPIKEMPVLLYWETAIADAAWTGEEGGFAFLGLPDGDYAIGVGVWGGWSLERHQYTLDESNPSVQIDIELDLAELSGTVYRAGGTDPVDQVAVALVKDGNLVDIAHTDDEGRYRFWLLEGGTFEVTASHESIGFVSRSGIHVSAGQDVPGQDLVGGSVTLTVAVSAGTAAVHEAQVVLKPDGWWAGAGDELWSFSYEDGSAPFLNLAPGDYEALVSADGFATQRQAVTVGAGDASLAVALEAGRTLQGMILDESGDPVQAARVVAVSAGGGPELITFTDGEGQYSSSSLPNGSFDLWIVDGNHRPYLVEDLTIPGPDPHIEDATLDPTGYAIDGLVTDAGAAPLAGVDVVVYSSDGVLLLRSVTDRAGAYEIEPLAAGTYRLTFHDLGLVTGEAEVAIGGNHTLAPVVLEGPVSLYATEEWPAGRFTQAPHQESSIAGKLYRIPGTNIYDATGILETIESIRDWTPAILGGRLEQRVGEDWGKTLAWLMSEKMPPPQRVDWDTRNFQQYYITVYSNYTHQAPEGKTCTEIEQAYQAAKESEGRIRQALDFWRTQHQHLDSKTDATAKIAAARGLKEALEISLKVISWQKDWLRSGGWLSKMINGTDVNGEVIKEEAKRILVGKMYLGLKKMFYEPVKAIGPAIYHYLVTGDKKKAGEAINSLGKWAVGLKAELADMMVETGLKKRLGATIAAKYELGIFAKIGDVIGFYYDLKKYHDLTKKDVDENVIAEIENWWRASLAYHQAVYDHRANTDAVNEAARVCVGKGFTPPSDPPPGLIFLGRGRTSGGAPDDPNEKQTVGVGAEGFITGDSAILYTVRFENVPTATLSAQLVVVTDQLDPNLDLSSLELVSIGFNHQVIEIPPGLDRYQTTAEVETDPNPVLVTVALSQDTGVLNCTLESVDPITGGLPEDPLAGFLPPNDDQHSGEGYVVFSIRPEEGLDNGTVIRNRASIVFDVNDPIITNEVINTIDDMAPTSSVSALPAESESPLTVSWSGNDGSGSGVAFYDLYVSTDGGSFVLWQSGIAGTQASFTGTVGSTYGFYTVATDNVGHRQSTPAGAQATVTIEGTIYLPLVLRE